jgi:hypothetical protein
MRATVGSPATQWPPSFRATCQLHWGQHHSIARPLRTCVVEHVVVALQGDSGQRVPIYGGVVAHGTIAWSIYKRMGRAQRHGFAVVAFSASSSRRCSSDDRNDGTRSHAHTHVQTSMVSAVPIANVVYRLSIDAGGRSRLRSAKSLANPHRHLCTDVILVVIRYPNPLYPHVEEVKGAYLTRLPLTSKRSAFRSISCR